MQIVSNVRDLYHTLRHLKPVQVSYRLKYGLQRIHSLKKIDSENLQFFPLSMLPVPSAKNFFEVTDGGIKVNLLNKSETFQTRVRWNELKHGKLWNYHLQYADFLKQDELSINFRAELVLDLYRWLEQGKIGPEPYPASLRVMNVIRFLSENHDEIEAKPDLTEYLFSELHFLADRPEYHLLGNHLMENAFALLMGGVSFHQQKWVQMAKSILAEQIPEQILQDGAHFERSPMYHLIMLFRFLEAIYYLPPGSKLSTQIYQLSGKMLGWIEQMSFSNGDLAHFNDSTKGQSYSKDEIFTMATACNLKEIPNIDLSDSGYRKFSNRNFELTIDAEGIEPSYLPAHAHADSLSFILQVQNKPVITDPGVSTYNTGERRNWERSTQAHNTVTFNGEDTADVWSRFRVGRRPTVAIQNQTSSGIEILLKHKLKSGKDFHHKRNFTVDKDFIEIKDIVNLDKPVEGRLYFDPEIDIKLLTNQCVELTNGVIIFFESVQHVREFSYDYCIGFNSYKTSKALEYTFVNQSLLKIIAPQI
ncbi:heparinase II/III domain-containing protein [Rhodohalobacter sp. 614A]|uniref:heparinase II/III domain-containing protein n=1 Tax=Rhodohalobacter sp. 614A TaxID=2908649 RepID=UPI001F44BABD